MMFMLNPLSLLSSSSFSIFSFIDIDIDELILFLSLLRNYLLGPLAALTIRSAEAAWNGLLFYYDDIPRSPMII